MYFLILSPLAFIEVDFLKHHFSGFQVLAQDFGPGLWSKLKFSDMAYYPYQTAGNRYELRAILLISRMLFSEAIYPSQDWSKSLFLTIFTISSDMMKKCQNRDFRWPENRLL